MTCEDLAGMLLPALRGKITAGDADAIGAHVAVCTSCAHDLPDMQRIWTLLDAWEEIPPPPRVRDHLRFHKPRD
jgi:hypothetical protein